MKTIALKMQVMLEAILVILPREIILVFMQYLIDFCTRK